MSYEHGLFLQNIIPFEKGEKIIDFNESRKLSKFRYLNARGIIFFDSNLSNFLKNKLKKNGLWDDGAIDIMNQCILINYWDTIPPFNRNCLIRNRYEKTKTFVEYTGREIYIKLDNYHPEDNTKYLLYTRFIHQKRLIQPPTTSKIMISTTCPWREEDNTNIKSYLKLKPT